jgi:hypothetical protein
MKKLTTILSLSVLILSGCAAPRQYFTPRPQSNQKLVHSQGNTAIIGVQEIKPNIHTEVLFEPTAGNELFNGMSVFWIFVKNFSANPVKFTPTNISIENKKGEAVSLLTLQQVAKKLQANKSRKEWEYILASSLLAAVETAQYAYTQQTGTYSGYSSDGHYVSGTYQGYQPNTNIQYMAQQQNSQRIDSYSGAITDAYSRALYNLDRLSLHDVTLAPGQSVEGIVAVPLKSRWSLPERWRFSVLVDGSTSYFDFTISNSSR